MKHLLKICLGVALFSLTACQAEQGNFATEVMPVPALDESRVLGEAVPEENPTPVSKTSHTGSSILQQRKIIREGYLSIETDDYPKTRRAISGIVAQWDGFVSQENEERSHYQQSNRLKIRVPSATFENLMQAVEGIAKVVHQKRVSSKDVTEEYVDLASRLKAKQAAEERYYAFLRKAQNVDEMLQIQASLRTIREEIERVKGRLRYLEDQTSLSSLEVYIFQTFEQETVAEVIEDGFFTDIKLALSSGARGVGEVVIGLTYLWPIWILLFGIGFAWWRRRGRALIKNDKEKASFK
ncbi:MAG: DUF4349 domain-containing protein [Bacteroidota bacterium]